MKQLSAKQLSVHENRIADNKDTAPEIIVHISSNIYRLMLSISIMLGFVVTLLINRRRDLTHQPPTDTQQKLINWDQYMWVIIGGTLMLSDSADSKSSQIKKIFGSQINLSACITYMTAYKKIQRSLTILKYMLPLQELTTDLILGTATWSKWIYQIFIFVMMDSCQKLIDSNFKAIAPKTLKQYQNQLSEILSKSDISEFFQLMDGVVVRIKSEREDLALREIFDEISDQDVLFAWMGNDNYCMMVEIDHLNSGAFTKTLSKLSFHLKFNKNYKNLVRWSSKQSPSLKIRHIFNENNQSADIVVHYEIKTPDLQKLEAALNNIDLKYVNNTTDCTLIMPINSTNVEWLKKIGVSIIPKNKRHTALAINASSSGINHQFLRRRAASKLFKPFSTKMTISQSVPLQWELSDGRILVSEQFDIISIKSNLFGFVDINSVGKNNSSQLGPVLKFKKMLKEHSFRVKPVTEFQGHHIYRITKDGIETLYGVKLRVKGIQGLIRFFAVYSSQQAGQMLRKSDKLERLIKQAYDFQGLTSSSPTLNLR